ncbi:MAG: hypothetical protein K8L97_28295 [Anaerolineae bacterium]|nr:hypothetical protein [Anaerolineae bacterium]
MSYSIQTPRLFWQLETRNWQPIAICDKTSPPQSQSPQIAQCLSPTTDNDDKIRKMQKIKV